MVPEWGGGQSRWKRDRGVKCHHRNLLTCDSNPESAESATSPVELWCVATKAWLCPFQWQGASPATQTDHLQVPTAERNGTWNKPPRAAGVALGAGWSFVAFLQLPSTEPMSPISDLSRSCCHFKGQRKETLKAQKSGRFVCFAGTGFWEFIDKGDFPSPKGEAIKVNVNLTVVAAYIDKRAFPGNLPCTRTLHPLLRERGQGQCSQSLDSCSKLQ